MENIIFVLVQEKKTNGITERKDIYTERREVSEQYMYNFHAHCVLKRYTAAVELEKNCTYEIEVRHPQVVLRCET